MSNQDQMPEGWRVSGWGPEGEGAEATGPNGVIVAALTTEELPEAVRAHQRGETVKVGYYYERRRGSR